MEIGRNASSPLASGSLLDKYKTGFAEYTKKYQPTRGTLAIAKHEFYQAKFQFHKACSVWKARKQDTEAISNFTKARDTLGAMVLDANSRLDTLTNQATTAQAHLKEVMANEKAVGISEENSVASTCNAELQQDLSNRIPPARKELPTAESLKCQ